MVLFLFSKNIVLVKILAVKGTLIEHVFFLRNPNSADTCPKINQKKNKYVGLTYRCLRQYCNGKKKKDLDYHYTTHVTRSS